MSVLTDIQSIFRDILDDGTLVISAEMDAANIEGWDSLSHIIILSSIQDHFHIEFSTKEVVGLRTVGDMVNLVKGKLSIRE